MLKDPNTRKRLMAALCAVASLAFASWNAFLPTEEFQSSAEEREEPARGMDDEAAAPYGGNTLTGNVRVEGVLMPNGTVTAYGSSSIRPIAQKTIVNGTYELINLPPGKLQLLVSSQMLADAAKKPERPKSLPPLMTQSTVQKKSLRRARAKTLKLDELDQHGSKAVFKKIDLLYGSFSSPKKILIDINSGNNVFDIELELHDDSTAMK